MNTIRRSALTVILSLVFVVSPALADKVRYDYDETVAFSTWKTWAWKEAEAGTGAALAEARVRRALAAGLADKGYVEGDARSADFLVATGLVLHRDLRVDDMGGPRLGRSVRVDARPMATIVLDVFERSTGRLAWRGAVSDRPPADPDQAKTKTDRSIARLLKKFPDRPRD